MDFETCRLPAAAHAFVFALGVAAALVAAPASGAGPGTRVVKNCNDRGAGSLRSAVFAAPSGATIDLSRLACRRIVLTSGQIDIPQASLTLLGRHRDAITIDGNLADRVLAHTGTGTLRVKRVSLARGYRDAWEPEDGMSRGGCIYSRGSVELRGAQVHHCTVYHEGGLSGYAMGGGIYAEGDVRLSYSRVFANLATGRGYGGGVYGRDVEVLRSQVHGNHAVDRLGHGGGVRGRRVRVLHSTIHGNLGHGGGGVHAYESVLVYKSTVSGNRESSQGGAVFSLGAGVYGPTGRVIDSTFSGNASQFASAAYFYGDAIIQNSTIAFNVESPPDEFDGMCHGQGALSVGGRLSLESTIVARNTCTNGPAVDIGRGTVEGRRNLVGASSVPLPPDTIVADPRLAPLADNGGSTRTHLPRPDSPAINRGSNPLGARYDQRGPGFPRVKGGSADIGAVER